MSLDLGQVELEPVDRVCHVDADELLGELGRLCALFGLELGSVDVHAAAPRPVCTQVAAAHPPITRKVRYTVLYYYRVYTPDRSITTKAGNTERYCTRTLKYDFFEISSTV